MACYIYNVSDGSLYLWGPSDNIASIFVGDLKANGLAAVTGLPALDASHHWNANIKTVQTNVPVIKSGGAPVLSDYPAKLAATGYALVVPSDGVTYNFTKWVQPNLQAFLDFCIAQGGWDKILHSQLNIYLQNKTTS